MRRCRGADGEKTWGGLEPGEAKQGLRIERCTVILRWLREAAVFRFGCSAGRRRQHRRPNIRKKRMKLLQTVAVLLLAITAHPAIAAYSLQPFQAHATGSSADAVAVGDINGDGLDDIALTTTYLFDAANDYKLFVYFQKPDGTLQAPQKYDYSMANETGLALADLDGDGRKDIIVGQGGGITVFRWGLSHGSMGMQSRMYDTHRVIDVAVLDVNRDGKLDVVGQGWDDGATIFFGDGSGSFSRQVELATPADGYDDVKAADFNGDGFTDFAVLSGQGITDAYVYYNDGTDDFSAPTVINPNPNQYVSIGTLAGGDFNGDGRDDLAIMSDRTHIGIYRQDAQGGLMSPLAIDSSMDPNAMVGADLNLDGLDDLVVQHGGGQLGFYLQGSGALSPEIVVNGPYATWFNTQGLAIGDINGDSCPDVVTANNNSGLVIFPGSGCNPVADLAVSIGLTSTVAAIRLENHGAANALAPQTDITLSMSSGNLSMGTLPAGCTLQSHTTRTSIVRCDGGSLAQGSDTTVLLPMSISATDQRSTLQSTAKVTTTTPELALLNNSTSRLLRLSSP
jgi:hypothetical protein